MRPIPIQIAVEDELSEAVARRLLTAADRDFHIGACYRRGGSGYLKKGIHGFDMAAATTPFLVITDLDTTDCPPRLIRKWLPHPIGKYLVFRVAVREVESWLLADHAGMRKLMGARIGDLPANADLIEQPKETLIQLARRRARREIREAVVPGPRSTAKTGRDYNGALGRFVQESWDPVEASKRSESLARTIRAIASFQFEWPEATI